MTGDLSLTVLTYAFVSTYPLIYTMISRKRPEHRNLPSILLILSASITPIYTTSLGLSWDYLFGYDINLELYYAGKVLESGFWDPHIVHPYNSVPGVVILAPTISVITEYDLITVFKIVHSMIFSLTSLVLWIAYSRVLNDRNLAFFASPFSVYLLLFYTEMLALAWQMIIAEFLIASLLLLLTLSAQGAVG